MAKKKKRIILCHSLEDCECVDIITLGKSFHCLRLYLWLGNMALTCLGCLINTCSTKVQKEIHPEEYLELSEELKIYNTTGLHGEFGKKTLHFY